MSHFLIYFPIKMSFVFPNELHPLYSRLYIPGIHNLALYCPFLIRDRLMSLLLNVFSENENIISPKPESRGTTKSSLKEKII